MKYRLHSRSFFSFPRLCERSNRWPDRFPLEALASSLSLKLTRATKNLYAIYNARCWNFNVIHYRDAHQRFSAPRSEQYFVRLYGKKRKKKEKKRDNRDTNDFHDSRWRNLTTVNFNRRLDFYSSSSLTEHWSWIPGGRTKYENVSDDPVTFLAIDSHTVRFAIAIFRGNVSDTHRRRECAFPLYAQRHSKENSPL